MLTARVPCCDWPPGMDNAGLMLGRALVQHAVSLISLQALRTSKPATVTTFLELASLRFCPWFTFATVLHVCCHLLHILHMGPSRVHQHGLSLQWLAQSCGAGTGRRSLTTQELARRLTGRQPPID